MADEDKTVYIGIELDRQAQSAFATSVDAASSRLKTAFASVQDSIKDDTRAIDDLRKSLTGAASDAEDLSKKTGGGFGAEGLRRTGGALTQLGLGEIGQPIARIGDITQVTKEFGKLTDGITEAGNATTPLIGGLSAGTAAFGAMAVAAVGFTLAVKNFSDTIQQAKTALDAAIAGQETYYKAVQTGTTASIQAQITALQQQKATADALIANLTPALKSAQAQAAQLGDVVGVGGLTRKIDETIGASKDLQDQLDKQNKISTDAQAQIDALNRALKSTEVAAQDATAAIVAQADAVKAQYLQDYNDSQLSVDAGKKKAEQIKATIEADSAEIEALKASGDQSKETQDKIAALTKEAFALDDELQKLNNTFIPAAQHAKELADKLSAADKAMTERADAQSKADDKRVQDMATAVAKADDDIAKITEQGLQKKIDIEKKYQDALLQAATRAAQQAADDLQKLYDQRAQNEVSFQRGEADAQAKAQYDQLGAQIKYQEETVKSYQDHLARLQDIQRNAQQQNVQNILDRNFLAIFQNQLSTSAAMQNENIAFGRSERDRAQQEQAAQADNQRQIAFDHQQRLIAYERANQDARTQYEIQIRDNQIAEQRSIEQARRAKTQELSDLSAATNQALSIRRQGLIAELQLITQGETQRLAVQQQFYQRALNLLNSAARGATINMNYNVGNNAARSDILQATARQTTQIVRQVFSAGGVQLVSS